MLASAEILSIRELAEIVAYITYLRRRKLVTDYLLKESVMKEMEGNFDFCFVVSVERNFLITLSSIIIRVYNSLIACFTR